MMLVSLLAQLSLNERVTQRLQLRQQPQAQAQAAEPRASLPKRRAESHEAESLPKRQAAERQATQQAAERQATQQAELQAAPRQKHRLVKAVKKFDFWANVAEIQQKMSSIIQTREAIFRKLSESKPLACFVDARSIILDCYEVSDDDDTSPDTMDQDYIQRFAGMLVDLCSLLGRKPQVIFGLNRLGNSDWDVAFISSTRMSFFKAGMNHKEIRLGMEYNKFSPFSLIEPSRHQPCQYHATITDKGLANHFLRSNSPVALVRSNSAEHALTIIPLSTIHNALFTEKSHVHCCATRRQLEHEVAWRRYMRQSGKEYMTKLIDLERTHGGSIDEETMQFLTEFESQF